MPDPKQSPYTLSYEEKTKVMTGEMGKLTEYHRLHCPEYDSMIGAVYGPSFSHAATFDKNTCENPEKYMEGYAGKGDISEIPFIPVSLFKRLRLSSIDENDDNYKTVTSSGTSGQQVSQIVLDGETRALQQQALAAITSDFLGRKRLPMLVIDCEATVKKRDRYSARTSGILGFSLVGSRRTFALDDDMRLNEDVVGGFLETYGGEPFLIFGFTYLIWQYLYLETKKRGTMFDLSNGIMIHGGGWKKLENLAVSKDEFKDSLYRAYGIRRVHDYYGMAEQTGSIYMECECGHLHASDYSAVLFRRPKDFSVCDIGEKGILQTMSILPRSYPGHSLLTEDEGRLLGIDDCPCKRKGEYFEVLGRIKKAELRGCSDTYEN